MQSTAIQASPDEAYEYLVKWCKDLLCGKREVSVGYQTDIYLHGVVTHFMQEKGISQDQQYAVRQRLASVFMSAAWELSLKGILRPGSTDDLLGSNHKLSVGSAFSLTERGKSWLSANLPQPISMSNTAMIAVVERLRERFGEAFFERAVEGINCFENGCYLACCAMCGASIESIFLVTAISKCGSEDEVLKKYKQAKGRDELRRILIKDDNSLAKHLDPSFAILVYWRDHAAHGERANIEKYDALTALFTLISLAQFIDGRWNSITAAA